MADVNSKPSVLICGGLNTCSRALASFLLPSDGEPLVSHLRIVDKFSVHPATTYIGPEFPKVLENPLVEYRQANLTVPATVESVFNPPEGKGPFNYVFDFTGEVRHDRAEAIQINNTCHVSRLLGLEAAKRRVEAFVRIQHPFYETSSKGGQDERADIKPSGVSGIWWHETLRILAAIEDLNLVILRIGFVYGPYTNFGNIASAVTVASVYGYMKKPMKSLWSPGKNPTHTVHVEDVAGAAWACAVWMAPQGRKAANSIAGQNIPFHNDKNKIKEVEGIPNHDATSVAPLFNLVDDSNSTLVSTGQVISATFGTTFEFFTLVESTLIKLMDDLEDINEQHVGEWTVMLQKANPPITNTPVSAYMDKFTLDKHIVAFDNSKIKNIVGYKLQRPEFTQDNIKEIVDKWKEEGIWPILS